eukprot:jgi/Galph1/1182/GphlegSOOS_G6099.1
MCEYMYGYLHGFASGPSSFKGLYLRQLFLEKYGIPLHLFDLNITESKPYYLVSDAISLLVKEDISLCEKSGKLIWRLIGSSLGAYTAARFASLFPSRVDKVLLLAPAFNILETGIGSESMAEAWKERGYWTFEGPNKQQFEVPFEFVDDLSQHPPFFSLSCDGTVIHGEYDEVLPLKNSEHFIRQYCSHWKLTTVMDNHALVSSETLKTIEQEADALFGLSSNTK